MLELELDTEPETSPPCVQCGHSNVYAHRSEGWLSFHCRDCDHEWDRATMNTEE